jgi:hypothetical protein
MPGSTTKEGRLGMIRHEGAGEFHLHDRPYQSWDQRIQDLLKE